MPNKPPRPHTVLLIGGHGRTAQCITRILLSHSHTVFSLIRNSSQISSLESLASKYPQGKLIPLVHDLNGISTHEVQELLSMRVSGSKRAIEWVIWAAGARANIPRHPQDQLSVERDAAMLFINEARGGGLGPGKDVKRVVMISACVCRKKVAGWWPEGGEERVLWKKMKETIMPTYVEAKTEVDELLVSECRVNLRRQCQRQDTSEKGEEEEAQDEEEGCFSAVSIRPSGLSEEPGTGKVQLGRTRWGMNPLSRDDLAEVVVELCETPGRKGVGGGVGCRWLDVGPGDEGIHTAVERCIVEDVDTSEL